MHSMVSLSLHCSLLSCGLKRGRESYGDGTKAFRAARSTSRSVASRESQTRKGGQWSFLPHLGLAALQAPGLNFNRISLQYTPSHLSYVSIHLSLRSFIALEHTSTF